MLIQTKNYNFTLKILNFNKASENLRKDKKNKKVHLFVASEIWERNNLPNDEYISINKNVFNISFNDYDKRNLFLNKQSKETFQYIDFVLDRIAKLLKNKKHIRISCQFGVSRSPTWALLLLIKIGYFNREGSHQDIINEFTEMYPRYMVTHNLTKLIELYLKYFNKKVITRYAPSPTGNLHIGGARTALFSFLLSKNKQGLFYVRLEDTDRKRNLDDTDQLDMLLWLGIKPDDDYIRNPDKFIQSNRLQIYKKYIDILLEEKIAYKCYCSEERLSNLKEEQKLNNKRPMYDQHCLNNNKVSSGEYVVRIKNNFSENAQIEWVDLVRGIISFDSSEIEDWIIQKKDGYPTYNFSVVIDDKLSNITHVIRGEEHISNTPKQIQLYNYFNWEVPTFGHLTLIIGENGKKLSKRDTNNQFVFINNYKKNGYLSTSVTNYLALLGWKSDDVEKEKFEINELINDFNYLNLSSAPSKFDIKKLNWFNSERIKNLKNEVYTEYCYKFLRNDTFFSMQNSKWKDIFLLSYKDSIDNFGQLIKIVNNYSKPDMNVNYDNLNKDIIDFCNTHIKSVNFVNIDEIKDFVSKIISNFDSLKKGIVYKNIRWILTKKEQGVSLINEIYLVKNIKWE